ncbi:MAG: aquaporin [Phycisphaerae bacterium]|nr:aquaporin [Phycisphaerae bacterium]
MWESVRQHLPEYAIEAALLGCFMLAACGFGALLFHADSPVVRRIPRRLPRRALMGVAMGATAIALIYSPWGQRSGAHMNPAASITFVMLGKMKWVDAIGYGVAHFTGAAMGVLIANAAIGRWLRHEQVNFVVTTPGRAGAGVAWIAEAVIAGGMMSLVLFSSNSPQFTGYTGLLAGALVAVYITVEAPLSGMSMNPARTFGSAIVARRWTAYWVYLTAPLCGMLAAAALFTSLPGTHVFCAKLHHPRSVDCIFRCEHDRLLIAKPANPITPHLEASR